MKLIRRINRMLIRRNIRNLIRSGQGTLRKPIEKLEKSLEEMRDFLLLFYRFL